MVLSGGFSWLEPWWLFGAVGAEGKCEGSEVLLPLQCFFARWAKPNLGPSSTDRFVTRLAALVQCSNIRPPCSTLAQSGPQPFFHMKPTSLSGSPCDSPADSSCPRRCARVGSAGCSCTGSIAGPAPAPTPPADPVRPARPPVSGEDRASRLSRVLSCRAWSSSAASSATSCAEVGRASGSRSTHLGGEGGAPRAARGQARPI